MSNTANSANPGKSKRRRGHLGFLIALTIVAGLVVFALAAAGVGYLYLSQRYDKAIAEMEKGQYTEAMELISKNPPWFEETENLMVYTQARAALAAKDYFNASRYFRMAGQYRDSEDQALEATYLLGCSYTEKGDIDRAKQAFRDVLEKAESSGSNRIHLAGYQAAVRMYDLEEFNVSKGYFEKNNGYLDSDKFLTLIEAHQYTVDMGSDTTQALYKRLVALNGFHDANKLMGTDAFIYNFLVGKWESDGKSFYFRFTPNDDALIKWTLDTNLPEFDMGYPYLDTYYQVHDGEISASKLINGNGTTVFRIEVVSINEMTVYCTENSTSYTVWRMK